MISNPYTIVQTNGTIHHDKYGEFYEDNKGAFYAIQLTDDGKRVYYDGTNWCDVVNEQPIGSAHQRHNQQQTHNRQHQPAPQPAPQPASQQYAAHNQEQRAIADLQHHHNSLVQSVNQLHQHVQRADAVSEQNMQALSQRIAKVQQQLNKLTEHVDKQIESANEHLKNLTPKR